MTLDKVCITLGAESGDGSMAGCIENQQDGDPLILEHNNGKSPRLLSKSTMSDWLFLILMDYVNVLEGIQWDITVQSMVWGNLGNCTGMFQ